MQTDLVAFCTEQDLTLEDNMIQNDRAMDLHNALTANKVFVLRWKVRECRLCSRGFDITKEGLYYRCGECLR
jgi:hypothetical protein